MQMKQSWVQVQVHTLHITISLAMATQDMKEEEA